MKGVLTDKQERVLICLKNYTEEKGYIVRKPDAPRAIKIL